ncbi:50S ribosomal protein L31 [Patescibacteria group bacterium]|nr:50S ribosomal protein L31 [Patescibacteria group bacterium]MBU1673131.1 50S ribosomal protein L31 [Patescibacteria group bacterium]MBU1963809.1 50S ribosomal protein L31 [Patescibacteria group bacterium]
MKKETHPEHHEATVTCACGNSFKTGSTMKEISVEVCSACHPYFTGKAKLVDTARRVEKFQDKAKKTEAIKKTGVKGKKKKRAAKAAKKNPAPKKKSPAKKKTPAKKPSSAKAPAGKTTAKKDK